MSAEQPSVRDRLERQLTDYAIEAVKLGKLALLRSVLKIVGDPEVPQRSDTVIPNQRSDVHDNLTAERKLQSLNVLERCEGAFIAATAIQMDTDQSILRPSNVYGVPSEYMAISGPHKAKLFLHRPAIDAADNSPFPFWFGEETVSNDAETGLPTLYYRETVVDKLGNLQSKEWIEGRRQVIRPLDAFESIPFLEVLDNITIHAIAGFTEKADLA